MTIFPGHKGVSGKWPRHKGRQDEQRGKLDGKKEKTPMLSFEPLVPALPEAGSTTDLFKYKVQ